MLDSFPKKAHMKRRGFLKLLGIGAAVPAMAQMPDGDDIRPLTNAEHRAMLDNMKIAPAAKIVAPDDAYICMTAVGSCELMDWSQLRSEFDKGSKEQS